MTNKVRHLVWQDNQLTCLQEDRAVMRAVLLRIIQDLKVSYTTQGWADLAEPEHVVDGVLDEVLLIRVPNGWVGCSVSTPWFMVAPVLCEEFVTFGVQIGDAIAALTAAAKMVDAKRITVGTRAVTNGRHAGLAKLYKTLGCQVSTVELTRAV